MNAARHARAKSLFLEASRAPAGERLALVARLCGDDEGLRAEVEELLRFHDDHTDQASLSAPPVLGTSAADAARVDDTGPAALSPGDLFAGRYRVDECIGRGGMGAVYRVLDTLLHVPVALKVVHPQADRDGNRLLQEVRLARAITHHAVCRTFDAGEVDGRHYFTMEFVDGEDLATLLRRVGRLPSSRVTGLARHLCAGLAAAHARGVLHRDLKPANVMLDRRGDIRITDFGIAVPAGPSADVRQVAGTPAYMAPEVLAGAPASRASDIYALGLVLYELVTGVHPTNGAARQGLPIPRPSMLVGDVPSGLDDAIMAALAPAASARPASALALAAMLPGGDVLALARDAGLTPPPQVVAGAGGVGTLGKGAGVRWLAAWTVGLVLVMATAGRRPIDRLPMADPPAVLAGRAEAQLRAVARTPRPPHRIHRLQPAGKSGLPSTAPMGDPVESAWVVYREAPSASALGVGAAGARDALSVEDPIPTAPGSAAIAVTVAGHLRALRLVPPVPSSSTADARAVWPTLWAWSGVDPASVAPTTPRLESSEPFADRTWVWTGRLVTGPPVRIEATTLRGTVTMFHVTTPSSSSPTPEGNGEKEGADASALVPMLMALGLTAGGLLLAWRNLRAGRSDAGGASRLGVCTFLVLWAAALLDANWSVLGAQPDRPWTVAGIAMVGAALAGIFYLASEPTVRRHWPESLVAWARLLGGRLGDPRVGREVLVGATLAALLGAVGGLLPAEAVPPSPQALDAVSSLMGTRHLAATWLGMLPQSVLGGIIHAVMYALAVRVARRRDVALAGTGAVFVLLAVLSGSAGAALLVDVVLTGVRLVLLTRVGLLALVAHLFCLQVLASLPLALHGDWRVEFSLTTAVMLTAVVAAATWTAVRPAGAARAA